MDINRANFEKLAVKYGRLNTKNLLNLWIREQVPGGYAFLELRTLIHKSNNAEMIEMAEQVREDMLEDVENP
jgi:hypothetical protein